MPTEKILVARVFSLQRQVIYQIKDKQKAFKLFALELGGIEFTSEAPALSRC